MNLGACLRGIGLVLGLWIILFGDWSAVNYAAVVAIVCSVLLLLDTALFRIVERKGKLPSLLLTLQDITLLIGLAITASLVFGFRTNDTTLVDQTAKILVGSNLQMALILFCIIVILLNRTRDTGSQLSQLAARIILDALPYQQMTLESQLHEGIIEKNEVEQRRAAICISSLLAQRLGGVGEALILARTFIFLMLICSVLGSGFRLLVEGQISWSAMTLIIRLSLSQAVIMTFSSLLFSTTAALSMRRVAKEYCVQSLARNLPDSREVLKAAVGVTIEAIALAGLGLPPGTSFGLQLLLKSSKPEDEFGKESETDHPKPSSTTVNHVLRGDDEFRLVMGRGLFSLVDNHGQETRPLLEAISQLRTHLSDEIGFLMPGMRMSDDVLIEPGAYRIEIQGEVVARGVLPLDSFLVLGSESELAKLSGARFIEPVFGEVGLLIKSEDCAEAANLDCAVFSPNQMLTSHLAEVVRRNAHRLLSSEQVRHLLDMYSKLCPHLSQQALKALPKFQAVLQSLLKEGVSILEFRNILEAFCDQLERTEVTEYLLSACRVALAKSLCESYRNSINKIHVVTLDSELESLISNSHHWGPLNESGWKDQFLDALALRVKVLLEEGLRPILLVSPPIRFTVWQLARETHRDLVVLSWNEIAPGYRVNILDCISLTLVERDELVA